MKHSHLSNFQKQQYTAYLETQLQKFSAFMLSQKKENQKYKAIEEILSQHAGIIAHLQSKIQMVDLYQNEVITNQEALFKKCNNMQDYEIRLRRLEDRERFDCDREAKKHYHNHQKERKDQLGMETKDKSLETNLSELSKRLKNVEEKITKQKEVFQSKNNNIDQNEVLSMVEDTITSRIKKTEKKMKKYFTNKFQDIQLLIHKSKRHKSKSPKPVTPKDVSISSRYEIECSQTPLTQFKLVDNSINKSELSTVLRQSKNTTISNRNKAVSEIKIQQKKVRKGKKDEEKSNRSKSKSKNKDRNKSKSKSKKDRSRSKSKSHVLDHSFVISDHSCCHSPVSRSKSNLSKDEHLSKKSRKDKHIKSKSKRSVSRSKSDRSSISLHEKCKRRPELEVFMGQKSKKSQEKLIVPKKTQKLRQ